MQDGNRDNWRRYMATLYFPFIQGFCKAKIALKIKSINMF